MITEENIGLTCKLEMGKLGQILRKAGQEFPASSAARSEGSFHGEVSMGKSGMVEKGRQEATETGIKRNNKEKAQQETSAAVATIISKTQKRICLVKAGLQQFSTAQ